jgi:membrane-bound serine protease (ClpP class)
VVCGILILSASANAARAQAGDAGEVVVLEATGVILPAMGSYIERGLTDADRRNAEAVILVLDTPGGSGLVMLDIVQAIRTSDVPVIVFVGPRGASAASAGLLVTLAGHASAMAPDTAIGATSPVTSTGGDLPSTSEEKAKEFISAQARSLAERRGPEALALANAAVNDARAVSSSEALNVGLIDFMAENTSDLLMQLEGTEVEVNGHPRVLHTAEATTIPIPMNALERFLLIIADPNIVSLLLSIGALLIFVEVRAPGGWVAGALGTIFLGLGLYGLGVLPVNWLGGVFILLAFGLFIVEIKAPTHGVLTAAGAASLAVGFIVLFSQPALAPFGSLSIPVVVGEAVFIGAIFFFIAMMALRAQSLRVTTGYPALIGQIGRVTQDINPVGLVQVFGERWRAESEDGGELPSGTQIEVVEASAMRLRVRRKG